MAANIKKVTILGDGAWGTAWATLMAHNDHDTMVWCNNEQITTSINTHHKNNIYLPDINLDNKISATSDIQTAIAHSTHLFIAIPVAFLPDILSRIHQDITPAHTISILSKGITQYNSQQLLVTQLCEQIIPQISTKQLAVVAGPSFATEVVRQVVTGYTIASQNQQLIQTLSHMIENKFSKIDTSTDIVGIQLCSALKNLIAYALGLISGIYKPQSARNTQAALLTKLLLELRSIVHSLGGSLDSLNSFAGIGDIVLTSYSSQSKNFKLGLQDAQPDKPLLLQPHQIPEARNTAKIFKKMSAKWHLKVPLFSAICDSVTSEGPAKKIIDLL